MFGFWIGIRKLIAVYFSLFKFYVISFFFFKAVEFIWKLEVIINIDCASRT